MRETNIDTRDNRVACGVAVVVTHQHKVLFGQRKSGQTGFEWQLPGGWINAGESPEQAARREVYEETGLQLVEEGKPRGRGRPKKVSKEKGNGNGNGENTPSGGETGSSSEENPEGNPSTKGGGDGDSEPPAA